MISFKTMPNKPTAHIYPHFEQMLSRSEREAKLGQRAHVFWLYGLSGSGKSTLAIALEKKLFAAGYFCQLLDGDNIRSGLNQDMGFTAEDRRENIRRIAEVAKLFAQAGIITLTSFITPLHELRVMARDIIGQEDFSDVYIRASFATCAERDPKGLYQKVKAGKVKHFTGKDSAFETPKDPALVIDTEQGTIDTNLEELFDFVIKKINLK